MFKSIRWRFILINSALVFIGIVISGVFIINSLESYNLKTIKQRMVDISSLMTPKLEEFKSLEDNGDNVYDALQSFKAIGLREEVYIFDAKLNLVASLDRDNSSSDDDLIDGSFIMEAIKGNEVDEDIKASDGGTSAPTKNVILPIRNKDTHKITGAIYLRSDLSEVYDGLDNAKRIIVRATIMALGFIIVLGYMLAKSVTEPINEVTQKARKMASGDFDQVVDIKSDDEIGKLGEMFNFLTKELKTSLVEISNEKYKLEAIINNMEDGLISTDLNGRILHLNPKAVHLLGIPKGATNIAETSLSDVYGAEGMTTMDALRFRGFVEVTEDGIALKVNHVPYKNDAGEVAGLIFVVRDVTEQNRLEKMRKEFVANVSHELKTPLTSIKTYTETVLDGGIEDEDMKREFLTTVITEADRMSRLVKTLLELSRYDSQKYMLDMEGHDMADLLSKTIRKLRVQADEKNQRLELATKNHPVVAYFDIDKIEQVVINIISNSIKYSNEGSTIRVELGEDDERNVIISVSDDGIGIPAEDLPRIFERFYRVDKARSRAHGGTGLGLAIAKEIVEAHGGRLDIDSQLGVGTKVTICLPKNDEII
jgi:two-component system, OmpR family, sensor histidine kinase VicK